MKIISNAKSQNRKKGNGIYYEKHHILPKSIYPKWCLKKSNLVLLTAKEHYFCHKLLMKIYPHSKEMQYAYVMLTNDKQHRVSMRDYEKAKIINSKLNSERMLKFHAEQRLLRGDKLQNKKPQKKEPQKKQSYLRPFIYDRHPWNYGKPSHLNSEYSKALSEGQKRRFSSEEERRKNSERVTKQMAALTAEERKARAEQIRKTCIDKGINCKKIMCVETGEIFKSATEANKKYKGHITEAARGKRELAAGYHWKYI